MFRVAFRTVQEPLVLTASSLGAPSKQLEQRVARRFTVDRFSRSSVPVRSFALLSSTDVFAGALREDLSKRAFDNSLQA